MRNYQIRSYTAQDRDAVIALQQLLWQGGPQGNAAYLDWKYRHNPYLDDRYIVLGWSGDELVGMIGAFGAWWETGSGHRIMLPCLADTVIVPDHRGGPLFNRMLDALIAQLGADGVPWLLDFGDQPAGPAMLMRGWKAIGPWPVATISRQVPVLADSLWTSPDPQPIQGTRSQVAIQPTQAPDIAQMATLVAQMTQANTIRHVRDAQYLTWRYSNPLARYFYLTAGVEDLQGYLIAHQSLSDPDDSQITTIVECEATSDAVWLDLIDGALSLVPGASILIWARDITPSLLAGLQQSNFTVDEPTGRLTHDIHLPNLLVYQTAIVEDWSPFAKLDEPSAWDLRSVCGRSWR